MSVSFSSLILDPAFGVPADSPDSNSSGYRYAGDDLGAVYSPVKIAIKLWAPAAKDVRVVLFSDATNEFSRIIPMVRDGDGLWSANLKEDLDGKYYLYEITRLAAGSNPPAVYRVNDPCARGCSANTGRTLIYDSRRTNPEGWSDDRFATLKNNVDAVLYEVRIRDLSINRNSGISDDRRGKYPGMVQPDSRTPNGEKSGIDHLKELGVSHVHLLPSFDYGGGDETQKVDEYTWYNWGYDPVLYNIPEGS